MRWGIRKHNMVYVNEKLVQTLQNNMRALLVPSSDEDAKTIRQRYMDVEKSVVD